MERPVSPLPAPGPLCLLTGCCLLVPPSWVGSQWCPRSLGPDPLGAMSLGGRVVSEQAWGRGGSRCVQPPLPPFLDLGRGPDLAPTPPRTAAQEARNKFEEAERSLRDMEEAIRYERGWLPRGGDDRGLPRQLLLPGWVAPEGGPQAAGSWSPAHTAVHYHGDAQRSPESVWTLLPLHRVAFPCRNLEQEISFDFGPSGEFAYLYRQCYELTTNE